MTKEEKRVLATIAVSMTHLDGAIRTIFDMIEKKDKEIITLNQVCKDLASLVDEFYPGPEGRE